jgi:hypothetical protein
MSSDPGPGRRYTDEEVRKLLDRASELESESKYLTAPTDGPTLQELEAIAEEAGLNALALREAARELDAHGEGTILPSETTRGFLGAPVAIVLRRSIPGEVPESVLENLVAVLQRTGETHVVLEERYENMAWSIHGGIIGGGGLGVGLGVGFGVGFGAALGALGTIAFTTLFPVAALGGSYLLSRRIYAAFVRRRSAAVQGLLDELVAIVEGSADGEEARRLGEGPKGLLEG